MPRSPSPQRYRGRYRDDSPPRYRDDRSRDWDDYRRGGGGGGDRREMYPPSRDGRDGRRDWDDRAPAPFDRDARDRDYRDSRGDYRDRRDYDRFDPRDPRDLRDRSPPPFRPPPSVPHGAGAGASRPSSSRGSPVKSLQTPSGRSGTPEEGQITSPNPISTRLPTRPRSPLRARSPPRARTPPRARSPLGGGFRRRSPSPPPRFGDRPFVPARQSWRDRERDRGRDWERDRERERDRDRSGPGPSAPGPGYRYEQPYPPRREYRRSPSPGYSRRSPSPSSLSSRSRSSRFASPRKRSPDRARSPGPSRDRNASPPPFSRKSPPPAPRPVVAMKSASPAPASTPIPIPIPVATPIFERENKVVPAPFSKPPPSGPRSDRIPPTGPRALSGGTFRNNPYFAPTAPTQAFTTPASAAAVTSVSSAATSALAGVRQEKVSLSPVNTSNMAAEEKANPYRPVGATGMNTNSPAANQPGRLSWSDRKVSTSSPSASSPVDVKPVVPHAFRDNRSTATITTTSTTMTAVSTFDSGRVEPTQSIGSSSGTLIQVKEEVMTEDVKPVLSATEIKEIKVKEEESAVLAEIATMPNLYGTAQWEIELGAHYKHIHSLTQQVNRSQSAARICAAVLADAEAERIAAMERRVMVEGMIGADSWSMGLMG